MVGDNRGRGLNEIFQVTNYIFALVNQFTYVCVHNQVVLSTILSDLWTVQAIYPVANAVVSVELLAASGALANSRCGRGRSAPGARDLRSLGRERRCFKSI